METGCGVLYTQKCWVLDHILKKIGMAVPETMLSGAKHTVSLEELNAAISRNELLTEEIKRKKLSKVLTPKGVGWFFRAKPLPVDCAVNVF